MEIKSIFKSKTFEAIIVAIGVLAVLALVFKAGELVESRKISYSEGLGKNYYNDILGPTKPPPMDFNGRNFMMGDGVIGSIIKIDNSDLTIQDDKDNTEKTVAVDQNTTIRQFRNTLKLQDLKTGDHVVVIGSPDSSGKIDATLIRVVPSNLNTNLMNLNNG